MKVEELIKELEKLNPDHQIFLHDMETGLRRNIDILEKDEMYKVDLGWQGTTLDTRGKHILLEFK